MGRSGPPIATRPDTVLAWLAARHHGVVDLAMLRDAGVTRDHVKRRTRDGRLLVQYPGVYAVGHACLTADGHRMAAVLAGGRGSVLSHRTAICAHELRPDRRRWIDITVPGARGRSVPGIVVHRCKLTEEDVTVVRGLPITTVERALLDYAEVEPQVEVDRALDRAIGLKVFDDQRMGSVVERSFGRHGLKRLRRSLVKIGPDAGDTKSELERLAFLAVRRFGLPLPRVNVKLLDYEADLFWPEQRLVVELDSRMWHLTPFAFENDHRKDIDLGLAGYEVRRFTWSQVTRRPEWVMTAIATFLQRRVAIGGP